MWCEFYYRQEEIAVCLSTIRPKLGVAAVVARGAVKDEGLRRPTVNLGRKVWEGNRRSAGCKELRWSRWVAAPMWRERSKQTPGTNKVEDAVL